jgi:hypothetical protein
LSFIAAVSSGAVFQGASARTPSIIVALLMVAATCSALPTSTDGFLKICMLAATPLAPVT